MKAMILAAGLGTRLRPLTETVPKPLLPVGGTPLIVWNLLLLRVGGIRDVIINLHYLGGMIEKALGDGARWNMRIAYSHEPELRGTGGGLKVAENFFEGESFLVINGDTLINADVAALQDFHASQGGVATLVVRDDPHAAQWGAVESDGQERILRINGQGWDRGSSPPLAHTRMFAGLHILHPSLLANVPTDQPSSIIDSYTQALADGSRLLGFVHTGYWSDVGTVERYAQAQADVEAGLMALTV
ncbi:MAG: NDP-sugar synthase [Nitrospirota bacterium]|nr:NDP-sugar synthase [Nitrospirota bacterium]